MHSERPAHRMYEQWHPLGILGLVTAFNFPVAVWSWNSALAAICGDTIVWKPSSYTPLTAVAVTHIANKVMADHGLSGIFNLVIGSGRDVGNLLNDPRISSFRSPARHRSGCMSPRQLPAALGAPFLKRWQQRHHRL
jgi:aldehyde dehydrogenase (NAD+)